MFGLIRGSCQLGNKERQEWIGHICGLCLTLRDTQGQAARIATNYDAALLSVLTEAQMDKPTETYAQVCGLRGFRRANVVAASNAGSQFAAAVALAATGAKVNDRVVDQEGWLGQWPRLGQQLESRCQTAASDLARPLAFETAVFTNQTRQQTVREQILGCDFLYYAEPTEQSVAAAFAHTAVLANAPQNKAHLAEIGRLYGRIMFLLDSYQDYKDDLAAGKFNALAQTTSETELKATATTIFNAAYTRLKQTFRQLNLPRPTLLSKLLVSGLGH
ncbi:MAG: DUF5685 family protein, partial [Chloroflexota bacterium]